MCSTENMKLAAFDVFLGYFFFSCSIASPVVNCGSGWTYGHHLSGTGCLRKLSSQYNQRSCLLNGHHITLTEVPWGDMKRKDLYCVRDEHLTYNLPRTSTGTPPDTIHGIETDDLKGNIKDDIEEDSKEALAKAMGCCLEGLHPTG